MIPGNGRTDHHAPGGESPESEHATREARVACLAQAFSERHRLGERPTIEEYVALHPELEAEIKELFPMLCVLEELGPANAEPEALQAAPDLGPLKCLGEYRIIREIGRGGMGVVYEAEQETLRRRVAIKVLPYQAFNEQRQLDRFRVEAQAAARLHHTNIVPVFGVGEERGVHYYVMQFIRGRTLAGVLQEVRRLRAAERAGDGEAASNGECSASTVARTLFIEAAAEPAQPEPAPEMAASRAPAANSARDGDSTASLSNDHRAVYFRGIARIGLQAAEALAYAHNEGVLHRDIKPSNLLLDLKGTVWITDFGLAKVQDSAELTLSGGLVGTVRYMAPERFSGAGDARSDVYGLGITLYELLTLRPAFASSDRAEMLRDVTSSSPPPPRRLEPSIPRDLETVVLKAIAREPQDRYASAAALAADLRRFLNREPVSARRARAPERLWRWCQRNRALAALSGIIALLLVALAAGGLIYAVTLRGERDRTFERLVASKLEEGRAWRFSRKPGSRALSLAALREAVTPETAAAVRNQVIGSLALVDLELLLEHELGGQQAYSDPHLKRIALLSPSGEIRVHAGIDAPEPFVKLPPEGGQADGLWLSPGGRYLAAVKGHKLLVWDLDRATGPLEVAARAHRQAAAFDATAQRFAHFEKDGTILVRGLPGGEVVQRLEEKATAADLSFDPAGRRLAAAGSEHGQNTVLIYDLGSGKVLSRLYHPHYTSGVSWHPDGKRLAVACWDYNVYVWEVESGVRLHSLEEHSAEVSRIAFSHRGHILASTAWDNRTLLWDTENGYLLTEAAGNFIAFGDDDRSLAFYQGKRRWGVWRIAGGEVLRSLPAPQAGKGPRQVDVSADGRWLAASCSEEGVRLWALDGIDEAHDLKAGTIYCVRFHPDSAALWTGAAEGLFRWPLRRIEGAAEWILGPPLRISKDTVGSISLSRDGRLLAALDDKDRISIHDLESGGAVAGAVFHANASQCEVSPSGRWLVSTTFQGRDVRVWDMYRFTLVHAFNLGTARACFSPDERWLAAANGPQVTLYETGSWRERCRIPRENAGDLPGPLAFSADSRSLALGRTRSLVSLFDVEAERELARFESPTRSLDLNDLVFSPDKGLLIAAVARQVVQVWDLRRMRRELSAMDLDWSPEEGIPEPPSPEFPRLSVDLGGLPGGARNAAERDNEASRLVDLHTRLIAVDPKPEAFSGRAAIFERRGNLLSALADLDRLLQLRPGDASALLRRAAILGRLGRTEEALAECSRAIALCQPQVEREPSLVRSTLREALRLRARLQSSLGMKGLDGAWRDWKELSLEDADDVETCENLGWLWILRRCRGAPPSPEESAADDALALRAAEKACRARPASGSAKRSLGAVLCHLGRVEEARPLLEAAWLLDRRLYSALLYLVLVEHRSGQAEKARSFFDMATVEGRKALPPGSMLRECFECIRSCVERQLETREETISAEPLPPE
jgi:serine/threonine protein kinase/WD40 repeat protein/tetratricopeptide (TPR) repeat protein